MTESDTIDVAEVIERQKLTGFILRLVAVSVLVTFFDGYDMQGIAYVAPYLQPAFHLDRMMLGNIFSAGIAGNLVGALGIGWLADRFGRRPAVVWSTVAFGVLTCAQALSQTYEQFLILRFIDGIAIGGMIPVCWALNIEYAPKRFRSTIVTIVMIGYTIGASAAGPIAVWFIPRFGWPSAFLFGGAGSLLAGGILYFTLPESIRFLSAKARNRDMIAQVVRRLAPERILAPETRFVLSDEAPVEKRKIALSVLFEGDLRWITPLLWTGYAVSSMALYFAATWGPIIFEALGFTRDMAAWAASANSLAGMLGGLLLMRFTDRYGPISVGVMPLLSVPFLLVCGLIPLQHPMFMLLVFVTSLLMVGGHFGLISIAGIFYPSAYRSMGTGWTATVAKVASILGPLAGGVVLSTSLNVRTTYAILAICPAVVGICAIALGLVHMGATRRENLALAAGNAENA